MKTFKEVEIILAGFGLGPDPLVQIAGLTIPRIFLRSYILQLAFQTLGCVIHLIICVNGFAHDFTNFFICTWLFAIV